MKIDSNKECYAMEIPKNEPTSDQVRIGLKKVI